MSHLLDEDKPLVINASMLRWLSLCKRKLWLDKYGDETERGEVNPIQAFRLERGIRHESKVQELIAPQSQPVLIRNWADGVEQTRAAMQQGIAKIEQAYLEVPLRIETIKRPILLRGKVDWLMRHHQSRVFQDGIPYWLYSPFEVKSYSKITESDKLQIDLYVWMLMQIQNVSTLHAEFLLQGTDGKLLARHKHEFDNQRLQTALAQVAELLTSANDEPNVVRTPSCRRCEWNLFCQKISEQNLAIDVLPRLTTKTRDHLAQEGIHTLDHIVKLTPDQLRQFNGIDTTAEGILAHAQAFLSKSSTWYGQLPPNVINDGWFFDIETIMPDNKEVWSIGWCDTDGAVNLVVVKPSKMGTFYEPLTNGQIVRVVPSADAAWRTFADAVDDGRLIFHWSPFDSSKMRKYAPEDVQIKLEGRLIDLCYTFDKVVKCPLSSLSLKDIAPYIDPLATWDEEGDSFNAYQNLRRWIVKGSIKSLDKACQYQEDDVRALLRIWKWLVENAK